MPTAPAIPATITPRQRYWRIAQRLLRSLALIYLLVCVVLYLLQTKLIFPGSSWQGTADAQAKPEAGEELVYLKTPDGTPLVALFGKAEPPRLAPHAPATLPATRPDAPRPAVLFFYGNGDCMNYNSLQSGLFRELGCHCLLIDYPGYGMSGGTPSEQGCYDAAEAAYQYLLTRSDVDHRKIIVAGWSLGGGVAIDLVHRHRGDGTIAALMTFSTFSSLVDLAQAQYPFLPISLLLKHRFLSTDKLHDLALPFFVGHGKSDTLIPCDHSDRVTAAYGGSPSNLTRFTSPNADHNDFFEASGDALKKELAAFLARATK